MARHNAALQNDDDGDDLSPVYVKHPYVKVRVQRNPLEIIKRHVPVHEVDILKAVHGPQAVTTLDEDEDFLILVDREVDLTTGEFDWDQELERIVKVYGKDVESKVAFANLVHGRGITATRSMRAMNEELFQQAAEAAAAREVAKAKSKKRVRQMREQSEPQKFKPSPQAQASLGNGLGLTDDV